MKVNSEKFKAVFTTVSAIAEKTKTAFTELVKISVN